MSFINICPYFSVVDNNRCPISIYSRFLIALFVLGIGLTASVIMKELPQNDVISAMQNEEGASSAVNGSLESFPRDFTLNSSDPFGSFRVPVRRDDSDSQQQPYFVGRPIIKPDAPMGKEYPKSTTTSDVDERPSLPANYRGISQEDLRKLGYIRHTTHNGDCLDGLAEQYLHDANRWKEIYELNRSELSNKDVIPIGIVLIIPAK